LSKFRGAVAGPYGAQIGEQRAVLRELAQYQREFISETDASRINSETF